MESGLLEVARVALSAGDALVAYDAASAAVDRDPGSHDARFLTALALAQAGAAGRAAELVDTLRAELPRTAPPRLWEDVEALGARLWKDRALAETGAERERDASAAAERYERVGLGLRRHFACVNAATMWLIAGDVARAERLAAAALAYCDDDSGQGSETTYWREASRAEALLILGDPHGARAALGRAMEAPQIGVGIRARTRRQLSLVCDTTGSDASLLDVLEVPTVVHYCGHRVTGAHPITARQEAAIVEHIKRVISERRVGIGYGSLASGGDVLVAECLVAAGAEVHIVLPFGQDEFERESVSPGGAEWSTRYRHMLRAASSVSLACDSAYLDDLGLFTHASRIAMGHTINRALRLGTEAEQLAVWDGHESTEIGGTAHDVDVWQRTGHTTHVIPFVARGVAATVSHREPRVRRSVQAVLFGDLRGFSQLHDEHYANLVEAVLRPLVAAVQPFRDDVLFHKTWGDGLVFVFASVLAAGRAALAMQEACTDVDTAGRGLPADLALRVAAHAGPLLEFPDPLDESPGWWGREMTRAAHIEPRTPEGEVYVTDAFAALLSLEPDSDLATEYVGRVTTAKEFETIPMYRLVRRTGACQPRSDCP